ncbi:MAG: tripartite tricarboxylate transporter substrate binding protein [Variovorax sp.]
MKPLIRLICAVPVVLAALAAAPAIQAAEYPNKTIRLLVPFPAGGAADFVARLLAADMSGTLGQTIVVENRAGASGNIGMDAAARSTPDGYTLLLASASLAINKSLIKATPFDPEKDFTPISLIAMVPSVLLVPASLSVNSLDDLVKLAKAKPDTINYGSYGIGTTQHLASVMLGLRTGAHLTHVPYKGADTMMPDLIAGRIQMSFNNVASALPYLKSGTLKALVVGLPERWPSLPDVPTFTEAGLTDMDVSSWVGLFGPAGLPATVVEKVQAAAAASLKNPVTREKILAGGNLPVGGTSAQLSQFVSSEIVHWRKAIEASGAKAE